MLGGVACVFCVVLSYVCSYWYTCFTVSSFFFFQAEDGIRDLVRSRGLGDVYKRQGQDHGPEAATQRLGVQLRIPRTHGLAVVVQHPDLSLIHI